MKNAVVGSGFIGSYVADELSSSGYNTTIFDVTYSNWLKGNQKMINGDIQNFEEVRNVVEALMWFIILLLYPI